MQIVPSPSVAIGGSAGAIKLGLGSCLEQFGAIGGGDAVSPQLLVLRFGTNDEAVAARAAIRDSIDGVRILVRRFDGEPAHGRANAGDAARLVGRVRGVLAVEPADRAFVVTTATPDLGAHLDALLQDRICGVPVRWQTGTR